MMVTPAAFAAGRKWSEQNTDAQIGTLPLSLYRRKHEVRGLGVWRLLVPFAQVVG
jgi:hypothetical protein